MMSFAQDLSYEAGEIILKFQKKRHELMITDKGVEGIASEADEASEELILSEIKKTYPKHHILSEEDYGKKKENCFKKAQDSEFTWVIDPLDGTNNFVNGIPIYAVSIALLHKGLPIVGVVYNPTSGECFFAGKGVGAFLIDFRINPFKKYKLEKQYNDKKMRECIFSPAPVYEISHRFDRQLSAFKKNIVGARAVRRLGSAALEICYVANGNFDGYWEEMLKPWDTAGAMLICKEAGVKITDFDGKKFNPFSDSILVASDPVHSEILGKISLSKKNSKVKSSVKPKKSEK